MVLSLTNEMYPDLLKFMENADMNNIDMLTNILISS